MNGKQRCVLVCSVACFFASLVWSERAAAQRQGNSQTPAEALVRVLQAKGILTSEDVAQLSKASSAYDADQRLAKLLITRGIISQADYDQMSGFPSVVTVSSTGAAAPQIVPAIYRVPASAPPGAPATPSSAPVTAAPIVASNSASAAASFDSQQPTSQTASVSATTLSAANPIRALPVGGVAKGELKPAIKLAGLGITPYGFIKATFVHDSSSPGW